MTVKTLSLSFQTQGHADILDITSQVAGQIRQSGLDNGVVTIFSPSSTSALTTLEYESGCVADLRRLFDEILPPDRAYLHNDKWRDGNGHSHARSALLKTSLTIPFVEGRLTLGTWQQIIFVDFDNKPRRRELILQVMGE